MGRCVVQVVHMDKPHQDKPPKMPTENYNYHHKLVNEWRTDLKPLNVDQPEGPSFQVPLLAMTSPQMPALPVFPSICQSECMNSILVALSFCWMLACWCYVWQTQISAKTEPCTESYLGLCT